MYMSFRPTLVNIVNSNNTAEYGPDIASYPVRLKVKDSSSAQIKLADVGSGVNYDKPISFVMVDYDNQTMVLDSASLVSITPTSPKQLVLGATSKKLIGGEVTFDDLVFVSSPGNTNVKFKISSEVINMRTVRLAIANYSQEPISVSFRYCMPGEIIENNKCRP